MHSLLLLQPPSICIPAAGRLQEQQRQQGGLADVEAQLKGYQAEVARLEEEARVQQQLIKEGQRVGVVRPLLSRVRLPPVGPAFDGRSLWLFGGISMPNPWQARITGFQGACQG